MNEQVFILVFVFCLFLIIGGRASKLYSWSIIGGLLMMALMVFWVTTGIPVSYPNQPSDSNSFVLYVQGVNGGSSPLVNFFASGIFVLALAHTVYMFVLWLTWALEGKIMDTF